ncbi:MAG: nuclease [Sulfurovum sp.]|nr:MAG: nuclease [Sulfurovum sp.]
MEPNYTYQAVIYNVVDGDTVDAKIDLGFKIHTLQRLRLLRVDTRELSSKDPDLKELALKAKERVKELCLNQYTTVQTTKTDSFGRYLVEIWLENGVCVNELLLQEELAVPYNK